MRPRAEHGRIAGQESWMLWLIVLGVLAAMGATWFALAARLVRRGSVHLIADRARIAGIVLFFALLQCGFFGF